MNNPSTQLRALEGEIELPEAAIQKFCSLVNKSDGCWEWKLASHKYGYLNSGGKSWRAHRFSYMLTSGKQIPDGMFICHKCDNPRCVRPDHLFLGTRTDNMRDMSAKRRGLQQRVRSLYCRAGHLQTPQNVDGKARRCCECIKIYRARAKARALGISMEEALKPVPGNPNRKKYSKHPRVCPQCNMTYCVDGPKTEQLLFKYLQTP